jgi:DNA polymerase-3 subunit epsilon
MDLLQAPLRTAEFLVVDTETNGYGGDRCEVTEIGAVLVGGGELHDRFASLCAVRAPLSRGVQRLTGITQGMLDEAPEAEIVLADLVAQLEGRVLVAHNASFDCRVLRQACERTGMPWPEPPVLCTLALARRFAPLARQRKLAPLAESLGIDVGERHRALADAETCARVLCALLPKLAAHATTVGDAVAALRPPRPARRRAGATDGGRHGARRRRATALPDVTGLPDEPGVYIFRNAEGQALYVGKSVAVRSRARAHFAPSSAPSAWTAQAATVDFEEASSELGALVLENRLIKRLAPPGNVRLKHQDRYVYLRCRLDIPFPVLEVAPAPAGGHAVSVGPLRGRAVATELVEQLNSLFGLRHCGRSLPRRSWPSAYGQMGRCLSPCLGDLDPNLYRRRLDEALALFTGRGDGGAALLAHLDAETRAASAARNYERAAWLRRRRARLEQLLSRLDGVLAATHARPRLVRAPHPRDGKRADLFWLVGGRVADWGAVPGADEAMRRTEAALRSFDAGRPTTHVPADEVDEMRIVAGWVAANDPLQLALDPAPGADRVAAFVAARAAEGRPAGQVLGP